MMCGMIVAGSQDPINCILGCRVTWLHALENRIPPLMISHLHRGAVTENLNC
jgi:hypothetical protein